MPVARSRASCWETIGCSSASARCKSWTFTSSFLDQNLENANANRVCECLEELGFQRLKFRRRNRVSHGIAACGHDLDGVTAGATVAV
jgi:hypothetical protein